MFMRCRTWRGFRGWWWQGRSRPRIFTDQVRRKRPREVVRGLNHPQVTGGLLHTCGFLCGDDVGFAGNLWLESARYEAVILGAIDCLLDGVGFEAGNLCGHLEMDRGD